MGVFGIGADIVGGAMVQHVIRKHAFGASMIVKDVHIDYLRRAESDIYLSCEQGALIASMVQKAVTLAQRQTEEIKVSVYTESGKKKVPVAEMKISMSVKAI